MKHNLQLLRFKKTRKIVINYKIALFRLALARQTTRNSAGPVFQILEIVATRPDVARIVIMFSNTPSSILEEIQRRIDKLVKEGRLGEVLRLGRNLTVSGCAASDGTPSDRTEHVSDCKDKFMRKTIYSRNLFNNERIAQFNYNV